jgi:hypothetical protein
MAQERSFADPTTPIQQNKLPRARSAAGEQGVQEGKFRLAIHKHQASPLRHVFIIIMSTCDVAFIGFDFLSQSAIVRYACEIIAHVLFILKEIRS